MKKLENVALSGLIAYQQVIEMSSVHLKEAGDDIVTVHSKGGISTSSKDKWIKDMRERSRKNDNILNAIQKEMDKRLRKMFGSEVTLGDYVSKLGIKFRKEMDDVTKEVENRKEIAQKIAEKHEKPVKKLDTSLSNEKKV